MSLVHLIELYYCCLILLQIVIIILVEVHRHPLPSCLQVRITVYLIPVETISRLRSIGPTSYRLYSFFSSIAMHSNLWVVDSGASSHFFAVREDFITLNPSDLGIVSGISIRERGHGSCKMTLVDSIGRECTVTLNGVLYVPDLALGSNGNYLRLLSVLVATNRGCRFEFTQSGDRLWTPEGSAFELIKSKGLVWLPTIQSSKVTVPKASLSKHTYYERRYPLHEGI